MTITFDGQIEVDCDRGVIYFHKKNDHTFLCIYNLPPLQESEIIHKNKLGRVVLTQEIIDIRYSTGFCSWQKNLPELILNNDIEKIASEYTPISKTIVNSIWLYWSKRELYGDFLRSCLENDLSNAVARADARSLNTMNLIVKFLFNHIPNICWGSKEKVKKWLDPVNPTAPEMKIDEIYEHEMKIFEYLLNR